MSHNFFMNVRLNAIKGTYNHLRVLIKENEKNRYI